MVVAIAAGKVPASPSASAILAQIIPAVEVKKMWEIWPMVQTATAPTYAGSVCAKMLSPKPRPVNSAARASAFACFHAACSRVMK